MAFGYAQLRIFQVTEASLKKAESVYDILTEPVHYIMNTVYCQYHQATSPLSILYTRPTTVIPKNKEK